MISTRYLIVCLTLSAPSYSDGQNTISIDFYIYTALFIYVLYLNCILLERTNVIQAEF